jgi:hypothetical protein
MKSKIKYAFLVFGVLIAIFGADLTISAKALNVESEGGPSLMDALPPARVDPSVLPLMSIGIIALVVMSRSAVSSDSMTPRRRRPPDQ